MKASGLPDKGDVCSLKNDESLVCILGLHCGAMCHDMHARQAWADSIRALFCLCLQSCCKNAGIIGVCFHVWLLVGSRNPNPGLHAFRATLFFTDPSP